MPRGKVKLNNPERYTGEYKIPEEKIKKAVKNATEKLALYADKYKTGFPKNIGEKKITEYELGPNDNWVHGMHTGTYLLSYELTGDTKFLDVAAHHIPTYQHLIDNKSAMLRDHDVGFIFSPSVVGYYKLTGDKTARSIALSAAEHEFNYGYSQRGGFILRVADCQGVPGFCRTMVDTMLNIPLLYWGWEQTGHRGYINAANSQLAITDEFLVREDASTCHHYQFEVGSHRPLHEVTLQGNSAKSTWSRGHSWVVYGIPLALSYNSGHHLVDFEHYMDLHRDVTYFALNHYPADNIPYWDYDFVSGDEPRDTSASVINVCGMLEAVKYLPDSRPEKEIYKNAAAKCLEAVIDNYTSDNPYEFAGLLNGVTPGKPSMGIGYDTCALYGDYYYLEALMRYINPDWKKYW